MAYEQERLLDDQSRKSIDQELDTNLMVLAGAGAGKTRKMVDRMVALVRRGSHVENIAAITFTKKAAGEMQSRFFKSLQDALQLSKDDVERERLAQALRSIDRCFIGTIHSFCGSMLRERAFDADLPPDFSELEGRDAIRSRKRAWRQYVESTPEKVAELAALGVKVDDLAEYFALRCELVGYELHAPRPAAPDLSDTVRRLETLLYDLWEAIPKRPPKGGYDQVQEALLLARRFLKYNGIGALPDQAQFIKIFCRIYSKKDGQYKGCITQNRWSVDGKTTKAWRDELIPDLAPRIEAAVLAWEAYLYPLLADYVEPAVKRYEESRIKDGTLTFADLLNHARKLLRERKIREYFQRRFVHLFVDEFQDTDPVQAEILFFLTDTQNTKGTDWQELNPTPGRLFVVGDGKQSIYRFRQADFETFNRVKDKIGKTGKVVKLARSFRTHQNLCGWVNSAFPDIFGRQTEPYQADFVPLLYHDDKEDTHDDCRVRVLTTEYQTKNDSKAIVRDEAQRIADFIAASVNGDADGRMRAYIEKGLLPEHPGYGDFMILTRTKARLHLYAEALEQRGIPFELTGAGKLGQAAEVQTILNLLEVVYDPDDPIAFVQYLRGSLCGFSDADIYRYVQAGGRLCYKGAVPGDLAPDELRDRFVRAIAFLRDSEEYLKAMSPSAALHRILCDSGYLAYSGARTDGGSTRAGNLLKLLAIVGSIEGGGGDWIEALDEIRDLVRDPSYEVEETSLEAGAVNEKDKPLAVQIMNVHQSKGLEAPVIFLADPYSSHGGNHALRFHFSRPPRVEPFVAMPIVKATGDTTITICRPEGWSGYEEAEKPYAEAEQARLLYVAATRAERLLIVSRYKDQQGNLKEGYWGDLHPLLMDVPELERFNPVLPEARMTGIDLQVASEIRDQARSVVLQAPEGVIAGNGNGHGNGNGNGNGNVRGKEFGTLVHRLMEAVLSGRLEENQLPIYAKGAAAGMTDLSHESQESAVEAVRHFLHSAFWMNILQRRATGAPLLQEVPLGIPDETGSPLLRRVDLIVRVKEGWCIIDFKTDKAESPAQYEAIRQRHRAQVEAYTQLWEQVTGEPVVWAGLWLTGPAVEIEISAKKADPFQLIT